MFALLSGSQDRTMPGTGASARKPRLYCCLLLAFAAIVHAQTGAGEWTWMGGSKVGQQPGVYGTQGTPAATNISGARQGAARWVDGNGNFWLFGGNGFDSAGTLGYLNDLWEFSPSSNQWTWIAGSSTANSTGVYGEQGTPAAGNVPGGRTLAASWMDGSGQLWLFGGSSPRPAGGTTEFNDLWVFNPSTSLWAWMGGSNTYNGVSVTFSTVNGQVGVYGTQGTSAAGNTPGSRSSASVWNDEAGHLWLFGGSGFDSIGNTGYLNDLWELNLATGQWTWITGSKTLLCGEPCTVAGVYGTLGVAAAANTPGGRYGAVTWTDSSGNLWLSAGYGSAHATDVSFLDDLWEFNLATREWTWVDGAGVPVATPPSSAGIFGTQGVFSTLYLPSPRYAAASWIDETGNPWVFGGDEIRFQALNDLWQYDLPTSQWAWMGGSSALYCDYQSIYVHFCAPGIYGTEGTASAKNVPGGRTGAASWTDTNGNLWLFGGVGFDSDPGNNVNEWVFLNDLWVYQPPKRPALPTFNPPPGTYSSPQTVTISDVTPGATMFYTTDGSTPTASSPVYSGVVSVSHTGTIQAMATAPGYNSGAVSSASYVITWPTITTLTASANPFVYGQAGTTLVVNVTSSGGIPPDGAFVQVIQGTKVLASGGLVNGTAIIPMDWFPGSYSITAKYVGSTNFLPSTSPPIVFTSDAATTTTALTSSANPQPFGQSVTFTATVTPQFSGGFAPPGTVTFYNGTTPLAAVSQQSGPFTLTTAAGLLQGTNPITAVYSANNLYLQSTSNAIQQVTTPEVTAGFQWTWMGGSNAYSYAAEPGVYDTLGVPNILNIPAGGRSNAATRTDLNGNLWLFGGGISYYEKNDFWEFTPSTNMWTWMGGTPEITCQPVPGKPDTCTYGAPGVYGSIGNPAPGLYPGNRQGAVSWTDASGNFWLFGGEGYGKALTSAGDGLLNDLWQYNPSTGFWMWMSGGEWPGQIGVYGAQGKPATGNVPGGRTNASGWIDSQGHFWLFGGRGRDVIGQGGVLGLFLNDLWEFDPSTSEWTWISGLSALKCAPDPNAPGVCGYYAPATYGTRGKFAASNTPGDRNWSTSWTDANGHFWLFGGVGYQVAPAGTSDNCCYLNELWEFDPAIKQWAWMGGSTTPPLSGVAAGNYGTFGVPDTANTPGGRYNAAGWTDKSGNLWLFGGHGFDPNGNQGFFNDLWEFNPANLQWVWMGGSSTLSCPLGNWWSSYGVYGTLDVPDPANTPGGRAAPATWVDKSGNFWLFAGIGYDPTGMGVPNDLWMYQPYSGSAQTAAPKVAITSPAANTVYGQAITLTAAVTSNSGPPPDGESVTFFSGTTNAGSGILSRGTASLTTTTLAAGADPVVAVYGGDPNFARAISATVTQKVAVAPSSTSLAIDPAVVASSFGFVTFSGWVTGEYGGAPTGTVTIMIGSTRKWSGNLETGQFAGRYGLNIDSPDMPAGAYSMTVAYSGDANFAPSTSPPVEVMVASLPSGLAVYVVPQLQSLTLQQTDNVSVFVSAGNVFVVPTGTVTLTGGSFSARQTLSGGGTTFAVPALMLNGGANILTATYSGDSTYRAASGTATVNVSTVKQSQTITFPALTTPVAYGVTPITLSATASSGLAVTFTVTGPATVTGSKLSVTAAGQVVITANQAGNTDYAAATAATQTISVNPGIANGKLTSSAASLTYGTAVTLTATFTGSAAAKPTGTVTFLNGAISIGASALNASGVATLTIAALPVGTDGVSASFPGDTHYGATASAAVTETVKQATPTVKLTPSATTAAYGTPVTLTATMTGAGAKPTGTVTFLNGTTSLGTGPVALNSSSAASLTVTSLPVGANSIKAGYAGDSNYAAIASTAAAVTVTKGTQTITFTAPATPVTYGAGPMTLAATGGASGLPVIFTTTGPASVNGNTLTITGAGSVAVTANQAGNSNYSAASAVSRTITVNKGTPTAGLQASATSVTSGTQVTFTATLAGPGATTPGGTVTFLDGASTLTKGTLASGAASYSTTKLAVGKHLIIVNYSGDGNYATATSPGVTVTVGKGN